MIQVENKTYVSFDKTFGISVSSTALESILQHCKKSRNLETGGILIGKYSDELNCALVSRVTGPPRDSKQTAITFERGTHGLKSLLETCFTESQTYYLGEWHFHPQSSPEPSGRDLAQLQEIANSDRFKCPEPTLLIIGGDPSSDWTLSAHVVFKTGSAIRLHELIDESSSSRITKKHEE